MLERLFVSVLNMSLIGSYAIVFVLIARMLLKKVPKIFSYALWGIVLFRLLCPFSFESVLSLIPTEEVSIPQDIIYSPAPQISTGIAAFDSMINPMLPVPNNIGNSVNSIQIWLFIGAVIWFFCMFAMLIYSIVAFVKLKLRLIGAAHLKENIYLADHISTPFVMGLLKPKIYLPSSLSDGEKDFIILHELCHLKRCDHVTRILGFAALVIHWFNPLVWIAFIASGKDMELSADEAVMQKMDRDIRTEYSQSLLRFGTVKRMIHATPLAFGEGDTKNRVKNVLNYQKPAFWIIVISIIAVVCIGIGLTANQKSNPMLTPESDEVAGVDAKQRWVRRPMIMVDDILYLDTGKEIAGNVDDSAVLGQITSAVDVSENPSEHGQCNFDSGVGAKYASYEEGMAVLLENKWFFFEKDEDNRQLDYSIMTEEVGAIGCEYGVNKDHKLDTLQMLSELEHLNGFQFDTAWASHGYIKFVFHDKSPDNIFLRCIANDMWQQEYPIDSAEYKIKVPPEIGIYNFFADITWENGEQETVYFSVEVKEHTAIDTIAGYSIPKHNSNIGDRAIHFCG